MIKDYSYGIIPIYHAPKSEAMFLLVQHALGHWGFPKGHKEQDESPLDAALRELKEETGLLECSVQTEPVFTESYVIDPAFSRLSKPIHKTNTYYIGRVPTMCQPSTDMPLEIISHTWFSYSEAEQRITYPQSKKNITRGI
jgi:bis(5'-nucleosidyl)-tetraphosphatase